MTLHPALRELLADPSMTVRIPPPHVPMRKVRTAADAAMHRGAQPFMTSVEDMLVPADPPVPIRLYRPTAVRPAPAILFCHGGGFVWGSLETHDGLCRRIATRTGALVFAVGYRLSPEAPFPAAQNDAFAVLEHLWTRAVALGVDRKRIGVCGDSAGAFVAAHAAARFLAIGRSLAAMTLIYPALDPLCARPSHAECADGPVLTTQAMDWFWAAHLPAGLPAGAPRLEDAPFPPTTILVAGYDPLRDEGRAFDAALRARGREASLLEAPDMPHGFLSLPLDPALTDPWEALLFPALHSRERILPDPRDEVSGQ